MPSSRRSRIASAFAPRTPTRRRARKRVARACRTVFVAASCTIRQIAICVASHGKTTKRVADELGISAKTVYVHRAHVLEKLGARNDRELYRIALAGGLITA